MSLLEEAREINGQLRALVILNAADAQGNDNEAAVEALKETRGIEYLPVVVGRR